MEDANLVPAGDDRDRIWALIADEHARIVAAVLATVDEQGLLDRHPALQRSVRLRNPYVDPMNAIQVELLRRYRDPAAGEAERELVRRPLLRSVAGISAALRNTGYQTLLKEFVVERLYRDAPFFIIGEGTSEVQRMVIAREILQLS